MTNIDPSDIRWRVGAVYERDGKLMGQLLGYVDARLVMEELDGLDKKWASSFTPIDGAKDEFAVVCYLTVNGVTRSDVGIASDMEPTKGAFSDSFKRAAVHFGIGRELYDLPRVVVECVKKSNGKAGAPKALPVWDGKKWTIDKEFGYVRYSEVDDKAEKKPAETAASKPTRSYAKLYAKAKSAGYDLTEDEGKKLFIAQIADWTGKHSKSDLTDEDLELCYKNLDDIAAVIKAAGADDEGDDE